MTDHSHSPAPEYDLLTGEAYAVYRNALTEAQRNDLDLYQKLSQPLGLIRVLYLAYLDLDWALLPDQTVADDLASAMDDGLVLKSKGRVRISHDGLAVLWKWKAEIEGHLRKPMFQALWRKACGW